jgi:nucleotide-binding universal stress UspA family protein
MGGDSEMKKVLAALDNSLAGKALLAAASTFATLLDAEVEALHVQTDSGRTARNTAEAAGIRLQTTTGPVVERLVEAGGASDVVALAIGARGTPAGRRPLGGTAAAVATALAKPVMIVPPDADPSNAFRRVLVPLEGSLSSSLAPRPLFELARGARVDVLALHIHDEDSIPAFTDQPQHERPAWAAEFVRRYCPWGIEAVRLETRVGRTGELIPVVAAESGCDLIALGWSQELSPGRALVVRETLARSHLPVLLVPVQLGADLEEALAASSRGLPVTDR